MSSNLTTFSFPLRSLGTSGEAAAPFLLNRFHGDENNLLVQRWCDAAFMTENRSPWPLVLYGPSGTGKTALAETLACRTALNCLYLKYHELRQRFHAAIATRSIDSFRKYINEFELLFVDDLDCHDRDSALERELVQMLDEFHKQDRAVLVTMRCSPASIRGGRSSLFSRLSGGLVIGTQQPGPAARREIAAGILDRLGLKIDNEDLDWLEQKLPDSVPSIKSYLSRIALDSPDSVLSRRSVLQLARRNRTAPDPGLVSEIVRCVGKHLRQRTSLIHGKSRRKEVVRARAVSMFLARQMTRLTFREIGEQIGKRDPSTVRHACSHIEEQQQLDPELQEMIHQLKTDLNRHIHRKGQLVD